MTEQVGLSAVFNLNDFSTNVQAYLNQVNLIENSTGAAVARLNQLGGSLQNSANQVNTLGSAFQQGLGIGFGIQAINMFTGLASAIANAGSEALNTVAFFERLQFSVQSIEADTLRSANGTLSFSDALQQAEKPAQNILRYLDKISLLSPFTPEQVDRAFQTATAYGLTANEALRLTQAFTDFAAARGISGEKLQNISLAISQISAKGKLMAQEMNQLAEAGVPIRKILGDALHLTQQQLSDIMEKGAIPANDAIQAIISNFEKYEGSAKRATFTFSGLISTLGEIKQLGERDLFGAIFRPALPLLQKFVEFASSDQFSAILTVLGEKIGTEVAAGIQNLTAAVNGFIATWTNLPPAVQQGVIVFGLTAIAVTALITVIGGLELAVGALITPFGLVIGTIATFAALWVENFQGIQQATSNAFTFIADGLSTLASEAVDWGTNIIESIAAGIEGAVSVIIDALNVVGQAITSLLQPGSPPKLLPELDTWGKKAGEVYLQGWTTADFSFLDSFGNMISTQLHNLVGLGKVDQEDLPQMIFGGRQAFAEALNQILTLGTVSESAVSKIAKTTGLAGNTVRAFLVDYGDLKVATDKLNTAQNALNATLKGYDDKLTPLKKHLQDIEDAQQNAADAKAIIQLKRVINNANVSNARRQAAMAQLDQIQTKQQITLLERQRSAAEDTGKAKVDAAQAALDQAKQNLDLLKAQTDEQLQLQSILAQTGLLQKNLADTAKERSKKFDAELDPLKKQLKVMQLQQEALKDHVREAQLKAILEDKHATAAQKAAAQLELQELAVRRQIRDVEASRLRKEGFAIDLTSIEKIPVVLADIAKKGKAAKPVLDSLLGQFQGLSDAKIGTAMTEFGKSVDEVRKKFNTFGLKVDEIKDKIDKAMPAFLKIKEGADGSVPAVDTLKQSFEGFAIFFGTTKLISILQNLGPLLLQIGTKANLIAAAVSLLALAWFNNWFHIQEATKTAIDFIKQKFNELTEGKGLAGVQEKLSQFFQKIVGYFTDPTTLVGGAIKTTVDFLSPFVESAFSQEKINAALTTVQNALIGFFASVKTYFDDPTTLGGGAVAGAKRGATATLGYIQKFAEENFNEQTVANALQTVSAALRGFFVSVQGYLDDPTTLGGGAVTKAKEAGTATLDYLTKFAADHFGQENIDAATTTISTALTGFFTKVQGYFDDPSSLVTDTTNTAVSTFSYLQNFINTQFTEENKTLAITAISRTLTGFFTTVMGYFNDPNTLGGSMVEVVRSYFPLFEELNFSPTKISEGLTSVVADIIPYFTGVVGYFNDPTTLGGSIVAQAKSYFDEYVAANFTEEKISFALGEAAKTAKKFIDDVTALFNKPPEKKEEGKKQEGTGGSSFLAQYIKDNFSLSAVSKTIENTKKEFSDAAAKIKDTFSQENINAFVKDQGAKDLWQAIGDWQIRAIGQGIGNMLRWLIGTALPVMIKTIGGVIGAVFYFVVFVLPGKIKNITTELGKHLHVWWDWIVDAGPDVLKKVGEMFTNLFLYLGGYKQALLDAGGSIMHGLIDGINDFLQKFGLPDLKTIWQTIVDSVNKFFGIESPSTLMHDGPGADIGSGLIDGIKDYINLPDNLKDLLKSFTDLVGSIFSVENIKKFTDAAFDLGSAIFEFIGKGFSSLAKKGTDFITSLFGGGGQDTSAASQAGAGQAEAANKKLSETMAGIAKGLDSDTVVSKLNAIVLGFLNMQELCQGQVDTLLDGVKKTFNQMQTDLLAIETTISTDAYTTFHYINTQTNLEIELMHTGINTEMGLLQTDMEAAMKKLADTIIQKAKDIRDAVVAAFDRMKTQVIAKINAMKDDFVGAFQALFTAALGALDNFIADFMKKLADKGGLIDQVKTLFETEGKNAGKIFADAIEKAILDKVKDIVAAAKKAAEDAKKAVNNTLNGNGSGGSNTGGGSSGGGGGSGGGVTPASLSRASVLADRLTLPASLQQSSTDVVQALVNRLGPTSSPVIGNNNVVRNYNLTLNTQQQSKGVVRDFWIMQTMGV